MQKPRGQTIRLYDHVCFRQMGDIHPRTTDPKFDGVTSWAYDNCDKNFVYYHRWPVTVGPHPRHVFLNSHPCELPFTVDFWLAHNVKIFTTKKWYDYIKNRGTDLLRASRIKGVIELSDDQMYLGMKTGIVPESF